MRLGLFARRPKLAARNCSRRPSRLRGRGIRHRGAPDDAMRVYNASNIVFDRVSITGFGDGAIDITEKARDITIQWSILGQGNPDHNFTTLIAYGANRVTVHHNLYINGGDRLPKCDGPAGATSTYQGTVCDVRNNVIWNFSQRATAVRGYGTGNVVNNYYQTSKSSASQTIYVAEGGQAYVAGNFSHNGWNLNGNGNRSTPYSAAAMSTTTTVKITHRGIRRTGSAYGAGASATTRAGPPYASAGCWGRARSRFCTASPKCGLLSAHSGSFLHRIAQTTYPRGGNHDVSSGVSTRYT